MCSRRTRAAATRPRVISPNSRPRRPGRQPLPKCRHCSFVDFGALGIPGFEPVSTSFLPSGCRDEVDVERDLVRAQEGAVGLVAEARSGGSSASPGRGGRRLEGHRGGKLIARHAAKGEAAGDPAAGRPPRRPRVLTRSGLSVPRHVELTLAWPWRRPRAGSRRDRPRPRGAASRRARPRGGRRSGPRPSPSWRRAVRRRTRRGPSPRWPRRRGRVRAGRQRRPDRSGPPRRVRLRGRGGIPAPRDTRAEEEESGARRGPGHPRTPGSQARQRRESHRRTARTSDSVSAPGGSGGDSGQGSPSFQSSYPPRIAGGQRMRGRMNGPDPADRRIGSSRVYHHVVTANSSPRNRPVRSNTSATGSIQPTWPSEAVEQATLVDEAPEGAAPPEARDRGGPRPGHRRSPRSATTAISGSAKSSSKQRARGHATRGARRAPCGWACRRPQHARAEVAVAVAELERRLHHHDLRVPRLEADGAVERRVEGERGPLGREDGDAPHLDDGRAPHLELDAGLLVRRDVATVGEYADPPGMAGCSAGRACRPRWWSLPPRRRRRWRARRRERRR